MKKVKSFTGSSGSKRSRIVWDYRIGKGDMKEKLSYVPVIKFKRLKESAVLPQYAYRGDAGFDLFTTETRILDPGERHRFGLGLASEIPDGYCVILKPKSGLADKVGIDVLAGVIDSSYRGEWGVILINLSNQPYQVKEGDKIAQGILLPVEQAGIVEVEELGETERGRGGFGSTDV